MIPYEILLICLVLFFAGFVHEVTGFGSSLVSMVLLTLFLPLKVVIPLVALNCVFITIVTTYQTHKFYKHSHLRPLLVGGIIGVPIGLIILNYLSDENLKFFVGLVLIGISVYSFIHDIPHMIGSFKSHKLLETPSKGFFVFRNESVGLLVGVIAGIVGAAINANGAIVGTYTSAQKWEKGEIKNTTSMYLLLIGLLTVFGHIVSNLVTETTFIYFASAFPSMCIGLFVGTRIYNQISKNMFTKLMHAFIFAGALVMTFA